MVIKLAESIQAANKKNNGLACYIPLGICNNIGRSDIICPKAGNSNSWFDDTFRPQNNNLATEQQDRLLPSNLIARKEEYH